MQKVANFMVRAWMVSFLSPECARNDLAMSMRPTFEKIGEIKETHSLRVSQKGGGLYLYLPKGLTEVHGIWAGDRIKATLRDLFRPKMGNVTTSDKSRVSTKPEEEEE